MWCSVVGGARCVPLFVTFNNTKGNDYTILFQEQGNGCNNGEPRVAFA